jgi:hypothetical protein
VCVGNDLPFANPPNPLLSTARIDTRRQTEPSREMSRGFELAAVTDGRDDCTGCHWSNPRGGRQPLTRCIGLMSAQNACFDRLGWLLKVIDLVEQATDRLSRFLGPSVRSAVVDTLMQLDDPAGSFCRDNPEFPE